jgi:hypothetical protein
MPPQKGYLLDRLENPTHTSPDHTATASSVVDPLSTSGAPCNFPGPDPDRLCIFADTPTTVPASGIPGAADLLSDWPSPQPDPLEDPDGRHQRLADLNG